MQVYEQVQIGERAEGASRILERCCSVCMGSSIHTTGSRQFQILGPVAPTFVSRVEVPEQDDDDIAPSDAEIEAKFGPSPFLRK